MEPVRIVHFSDVLCTWAYVSQIRLDELLTQFPEQIEVETRFVNIFGNVPGKMKSQWGAKGGIRGYAEHVRTVIEQFDHVDMHPAAWIDAMPQSSLPSHVFLCAARRLEEQGAIGPGDTRRAAWAVRKAFFQQAVDVSQYAALMEIAQRTGLPVADIERLLQSGEAYAALAEDLELARDLSVRASPSLIFNEGRQKLIGNVGYGIIEANVRELLQGPTGDHSWC